MEHRNWGFLYKVVPMKSKWFMGINRDWDDKIGLDFIDALELKDYVIGILRQRLMRADCLSMIGMTRRHR